MGFLALLLVARTLLGAPGLTTSSTDATNGAPGLTTRSNDATNGAPGLTTRSNGAPGLTTRSKDATNGVPGLTISSKDATNEADKDPTPLELKMRAAKQPNRRLSTHVQKAWCA